MKAVPVYIEPGFCFFAAVMLLILPMDWLLAAIMAAVFHELCHFAAVMLWGGTITGVKIGIGGARIDAKLSGKRAVVAVLAGPAGSLLLLAFGRLWPEIAICGFIQGIYNLLPLPGLDGGLALAMILQMCCPDYAGGILCWVERAVFAVILLIALYGTVIMKLGLWVFFSAMIPFFGVCHRKIPCKESRFGVQ